MLGYRLCNGMKITCQKFTATRLFLTPIRPQFYNLNFFHAIILGPHQDVLIHQTSVMPKKGHGASLSCKIKATQLLPPARNILAFFNLLHLSFSVHVRTCYVLSERT